MDKRINDQAKQLYRGTKQQHQTNRVPDKDKKLEDAPKPQDRVKHQLPAHEEGTHPEQLLDNKKTRLTLIQ